MLGCGAGPESRPLQILDGAGEVGHLRDGQVHDGAGGGLVRAHAHRGGPGLGHDHAGRAHDLGRAHDGAEVALVSHVVEHDDERRALPCRRDHVRELGVGKGSRAHDDALVGTVAG